MNNKKYILTGIIIAMAILGFSNTAQATITWNSADNTVTWTTENTAGNVVCMGQPQGRSCSMSAYNGGVANTCANWSPGGKAWCGTTVLGFGVLWPTTTYTYGGVACGSRICSMSAPYYGGSQACNVYSSGGAALCKFLCSDLTCPYGCLNVNGVGVCQSQASCGTATTTPANHALYPWDGAQQSFTGLELCKVGLPSASSKTLLVGGSASVSWTCAQTNGGITASCTATRAAQPAVKVDGVCGSAATTPANHALYAYTGSAELAFTSPQLCTAGTLPTGSIILAAPYSSTVSWSCTQQNNGITASCTATRAAQPVVKVDGVCGPSAKTYTIASSYTGPTCCASYTGTTCNPTSANPASVSGTTLSTANPKITWTCPSPNGGFSSPTCTAVFVPTPTTSRTYFSTDTAISTSYQQNLCSTPIAWGIIPATVTFPAPGETETWTCLGHGGDNSPTCSAIKAPSGDFTASCVDSKYPLPYQIGEEVIRTAYPNGGNSPYTYSWSGDGGLIGTLSTVSKTYSTPGTKLGQVQITDKYNRTATGYCSVLIAAKPIVSSLKVTPDYCGGIDSATIYFEWKYDSVSGLDESGFDLQVTHTVVSGNPDFSTLDIGGTKILHSGVPGNLNTQAPSVKNYPSLGELDFNTKYYWRVITWDANNVPSIAVAGDSFTTPAHAWPSPRIDVLQMNVSTKTPIVKIPVQLQGSGSGCYGNLLCTYLWDVNLDLDYFSAGKDATVENPIAYSYTTPGQRNEKLTVCDSTLGAAPIGCCFATTTFTVKASSNVPQWKEISPF